MKNDIRISLTNKTKNLNPINTSLKNQFPIIPNSNLFNSFQTSIKNKTKSTNEITFTKNITSNIKNATNKNIQNNISNINPKLINVFKQPKEKSKPKKNMWPKITHPRLPFSKRPIVPEEERKRRIKEQKPNRIYHDFYMIKWLRNKYSDSLIEKSVFSMLPDNGKPVVPEDESEEEKKHRLLKEFLDNLYKKVPEREKYVNINPKYFFDEKTFQKILKFKEIFLEFDEDQSRKMEIDEMVEMFNQNHINANLEDLRNLFFKDKHVKKEDIMKLYLDFYQFMNFALTKDQDFREFMREIKAKRKNRNKDGKNNEEDNIGYLPMNFNLMFDYFLMKGKERASYDEIKKSIVEMDKIINSNKNNENNNDTEESKSKNNSSVENDNITNKNKNNENIDDLNIDYEEQLKNLNFVNLINNFTTLFHINESSSKGMSDSFMELAANHEQASDAKNIKRKINDNNINISEFKEKDFSDKEKDDKQSIKKLSVSKSFNDNAIEKIVEYDLDRKRLKKLNINNYNKFHDVNLALTETKKEVNNFIKTQKFKLNKKKIDLFINKNKERDKNQSWNIRPLYIFNKRKKNSPKNYSNSVKINIESINKDINNKINFNTKSQLSSINTYKSKEKNKSNDNKLDYVPIEFLKEIKRRRLLRFFI